MGRLLERIRIGIAGLGWIGQEVARAALEDPRVRLVGVADADPTKAGRDLGEIIGEGRVGVPIDPTIEAMLARARPEVAVLCTTSDVEKLGPSLEACVAHGAHVVTTCENLAYPDAVLSQLEPGIEQRVRENNLVVLATGVNPGFAMDRLAVMLTQATRNIRRVRVVRVVNASTRRAQLQAKIGVGMEHEAFEVAKQRGEVGHAGMLGSLRLLAKGLGITLDRTSELITPLLATEATASVLGPIDKDRVRGIYQVGRGYRGHGREEREVITLELTMALDEPYPRDAIDIVGEPPLHFEGELPGDFCTVATVLSAIPVIVSMPPGLRTVLDVPLERPEEPSESSAAPALLRRASAATELPHPAAVAEAAARLPVREPSILDDVVTESHVVPAALTGEAPRARKAKASRGDERPTGARPSTAAALVAAVAAAKDGGKRAATGQPRRASKAAGKGASKAAGKGASKAAGKGASKVAGKGAAKAAGKGAAKAAGKGAAKAAGRPR